MTLISFILFVKNESVDGDQAKTYSGVKVTYTIPLINVDGSLTEKKSLYEVFYVRDLLIYNFFYTFDSSVNNESVFTESRNYYFVFHKDSLSGYIYYPYFHTHFSENRLPVDSMLDFHTFRNNKFDSLQFFQPVSSFSERDSDSIDVYRNVWPHDPREDFTIYLYYSKKFNWVKESFARKLDSKKKMKLTTIKVVASGGYFKEYNMNIPKREYVYKMSALTKKELKERSENLEQARKYYLLRTAQK